MDGAHAMLQMTLTDITPVRCLEDGWNYVARLRDFGGRFGRIAAEMRAQTALGIVPPRFVLDKVLQTVRKLKAEAEAVPCESAMLSSLKERLVAADGAAIAPPPQTLLDAAADAMRSAVAPAYAVLQAPAPLFFHRRADSSRAVRAPSA
eukprot:5392848-Pleurochrysis_carterae.AAC.1